jgi:hypothetical protein
LQPIGHKFIDAPSFSKAMNYDRFEGSYGGDAEISAGAADLRLTARKVLLNLMGAARRSSNVCASHSRIEFERYPCKRLRNSAAPRIKEIFKLFPLPE